MKRCLSTVLALGLAWFAGCGGAVDGGPAATPRAVLNAPLGPGEADATLSVLPVLRKMNRAPSVVAHRGVRRVEQFWTVEDQPRELRYRENVASDGAGRFAVEAFEQLAPDSTPHEEQVFVILQKAREGFVRRYRDFAVRDVEGFVRNYSFVDTGALVTVAGRQCNEYLVQRTVDDSVRYWVAVDTQTALVLRTRHESAAGVLLGLVEFESLDLTPDLGQVAWHQPLTDEQPLSADPAAARAQLGFEPRLPRTDGGRFQLESATAVSAPDPRGSGTLMWAKHTLTDGVEVVFFLHGGPDPAPTRDDWVRVAPPVGPWSSAEGSLHGERFVSMGRVPVEELLDLLEDVL